MEMKHNDSVEVVEKDVLQERNIGTFGAISLIVNKIIGAGFVLHMKKPLPEY